MAESAVLHLLANFVAPFLQQEMNLLSGVRGEIEYIKDEFEHMSTFLTVAEAREENDQELKVWVKQVRDVAYGTEDVKEKFMLHLAHHHGNGFRGFLCKIPYFVKTLKARHQIASEVQRIKSKVVNISQGRQRYQDRYGIPEGSRSTIVNNPWYDCHDDVLLLEETKLVGIEKPKRRLIGLLIEGGTRLKAVSVVGMERLGKPTLVKKVYDDKTVKKHFNNHAWLTISELINIEDLMKDMVQQLFTEILQPVLSKVETISINRLKGMVKDFLQQRRYVVVFDDVWKVDVWDAVKSMLPDDNLQLVYLI
ncbi:hypothetical protein ACSBR2_037397 [Camellia fascicularis]